MHAHDDGGEDSMGVEEQERLDERLIAFLDGETDAEETAAIIALQESDPKIRARVEQLANATELARISFDEVLEEPVPAHLLALGRASMDQATEDEPASSAVILPFRKRPPESERRQRRTRFGRLLGRPPAQPAGTTAGKVRPTPQKSSQGSWAGFTAVAAMTVLVVGFSISLFSSHIPMTYQPIDPSAGFATDPTGLQLAGAGNDVPADTGLGSAGWIDTVAGYHNLFIANAQAAENTVFDVTPQRENALPGDVRVPDLGRWSLQFQGARRIVLDGKPAFQFFYRPDDASAPAAASGISNASATAPTPAAQPKPAPTPTWRGPVTLFVTTGDPTTERPERPPNFQRRDNVNLTFWRHRGHGYALVGQADKGWMFTVAGDIAYQTGGPH